MPKDNDPHEERNDPSLSEWDQAEAARKIASSVRGSARKRLVRKRISREEVPEWEIAPERPGTPTNDALIEKLDDEFQRGGASSGGQRKRRQQGVHVREIEYHPGRNFAIIVTVATLLAIVGAISYAVLKQKETETESDYVSGDLDGFLRGEAGKAKQGPDNTLGTVNVRPDKVDINVSRLDPVRECITNFLTAGSIEERLPFVRPTPGVREHMEAMADHPLMRIQIEPTFGPDALIKGDFVYAEIYEAAVGFRGATVELDGDTARLDFDSFLGYSNIDWADLESGDVTEETEVRALVSLLPNLENDPPAQRRAIVRDPSQTFTVYAMIAIYSIPQKFAVILENSQQPLPYLIKIETVKPEDGARAMPTITEVVAAGWFKEVDFASASVPPQI